MPRYHLHLHNLNARKLLQDEEGAEFDSLEDAYLAAFAGAQELWAEFLPQRRDPRDFAYEIADASGTVLMEIPFAEILDSCRGAGRRNEPTPVIVSDPHREAHQKLSRKFIQLCLRSREEIARARQTMQRSRDLVRDCRLLRSKIAL
jgi:hypothetical protein